MVSKTESIKLFLEHETHKDLAGLYNQNMEVQVIVGQDGGRKIVGETKNGRKWTGWTDETQVWKSFRIPWKANSNPEYTDSKIQFDLAQHCEAIGMTGWDWKNRVSKWVAYDFDAIVGHSERHVAKISDAEMGQVQAAAQKIPWVTVRKSTSGNGLHLYVFLDNFKTQNHTEHAALARAILAKMSALVGYDFNSKVDNCGGNMWVWHRKMKDSGGYGLKLIKKGGILKEAPLNWQDHLAVTSGKRQKTAPGFLDETELDPFEELCGQYVKTPLDDEHKRLIKYLEESGAYWWFDPDLHILVCHTYDLKMAHNELSMRGIFDTVSKGNERGADQNCFARPLRKGAWVVRRHTPGVGEVPTWDQDSGGYTRCYLNREPDLEIAARAKGGVEHKKAGWVFKEAEVAMQALAQMGTHIDLPPKYGARTTHVIPRKDGKIILEMKREDGDVLADGWLEEKGKWQKVIKTPAAVAYEPEVNNYDDVIRHLVTLEGSDAGWVIRSDNLWVAEPLSHIKMALQAQGIPQSEINVILGSSITRRWTLVNYPFQHEYPGDRKWNRKAAQLAFTPSQDLDNLYFETWHKILNHCGEDLNIDIKNNEWCKNNAIDTGGEYLKLWLASLFQFPLEPLPYLFFTGPQNSGKSTFHEALSLLITRGVVRADMALTSAANFNAELHTAVACVIEETDLSSQKATVYNKIKDWVTSRTISVHEKGKTPYEVPNTTHWIQCSNNVAACPIFPGDTRITMMYVDVPKEQIQKTELLKRLEKEAPDFLAHILDIEVPKSRDRLRIPVIENEEKRRAERLNQSELDEFLAEKCHHIPGQTIKYGDMYTEFRKFLGTESMDKWTKKRMGNELPKKFPKGRSTADGQWHVGNISFDKDAEPQKRLIVIGDMLRPEDYS